MSHQTKTLGPKDDAKIVRGYGTCNKEWDPVDIKNNSDDKFLTVTVKESTTLNSGSAKVETKVFERLAPKEQRELGCRGCGEIATGTLCIEYSVEAAIYV